MSDDQPKLWAPRPPKPRRPARPRRVLAVISDAGECFREYTCQRCGLVWSPPTSRDDDEAHADHFERYGTAPDARRMCPCCNPPEVFAAWGVEADEVEGAAP